jgi:hypothetical protein
VKLIARDSTLGQSNHGIVSATLEEIPVGGVGIICAVASREAAGGRKKGEGGSRGVLAMKTPILLIAAASLIALGGVATAADHLFTADEHGLSNKTITDHPFALNSQQRSGDTAAGRGSPFVFFDPEDAGIPSTDTPAAHKGQTLPAAAFSGK